MEVKCLYDTKTTTIKDVKLVPKTTLLMITLVKKFELSPQSSNLQGP